MTKAKQPLRAVMPTLPFPRPWKRTNSRWWSLYRGHRIQQWGTRGIRYDARVYLNGAGTDPELRFYVWDWNRERTRFPCLTCNGIGRRDRPQNRLTDNPFLFPGQEQNEWDPADENGLRRCFRCVGTGKVDPFYGAANSFIRAPGLKQRIQASRRKSQSTRHVNLNARGLYDPSLADVLCVMGWCDDMAALIAEGKLVTEGMV